MKFDVIHDIFDIPGDNTDDEIDELIKTKYGGKTPDWGTKQWDKYIKDVQAIENRYEDQYSLEDIYFENRGDLSCAFGEVKGSFPNGEEACWYALCYILTKTKEEGRPTFVPVTDKEHMMRDYLDSCPYATRIAQAKSRHGEYQSYIYLIGVPE